MYDMKTYIIQLRHNGKYEIREKYLGLWIRPTGNFYVYEDSLEFIKEFLGTEPEILEVHIQGNLGNYRIIKTKSGKYVVKKSYWGGLVWSELPKHDLPTGPLAVHNPEDTEYISHIGALDSLKDQYLFITRTIVR